MKALSHAAAIGLLLGLGVPACADVLDAASVDSGAAIFIPGPSLDLVARTSFLGGFTESASWSLEIGMLPLDIPGTPVGPTIVSFAPNAGIAGDVITVVASSVKSVRGVSVGAQPASFVVLSPGELAVTVPEGDFDGPIALWTSDGVAVSAGEFRRVPSGDKPVLSHFHPVSGIADSQVTLSGTNLSAVTGILMGNVAVDFLRADNTHLTLAVPAEAKSAPFSLQFAQGVVESADIFEVLPPPAMPSIKGIEPASGVEGTPVDISGANFFKVVDVSFGGVHADFIVVDESHLLATVPPGATGGAVSVTTDAGEAFGEQLFKVPVPPVIPLVTDVSTWKASPGQTARVRGNALGGARKVFVAGVPAGFKVIGAGELIVTIPAGARSGAISVVTDLGTADSPFPLVVPSPADPPVTAPRIQAAASPDGGVQLTYPVAANTPYVVESSARLGAGWTEMGASRPQFGPGVGTLLEATAIEPSVFYRIAAGVDFFDNWDFENGLTGWSPTSEAFDDQPVHGEAFLVSQVATRTRQRLVDNIGGDYWNTTLHIGHHGDHWLSTGQSHPEPDSPLVEDPRPLDARVGLLYSGRFRITRPWISALIGGHLDSAQPPERSPRIELQVSPTNSAERLDFAAHFPQADPNFFVVWRPCVRVQDAEWLRRAVSDVRRFVNHVARLVVIDESTEGHINADDFRFHDEDPRPGLINLYTSFPDYDYRDPDAPVWGFADTHTHPFSHLGFGGQLIAGHVGGHSQVSLQSCEYAHGVNGGNGCFPIFFCAPSVLMSEFTGGFGHRTGGYEYGFDGWPTVMEEGVHPQMTEEWIRRAWQGGLRLMVALAVHNRMLADLNFSNRDKDDIPVARQQLQAIHAMVGRNLDFMEIAGSPRHAREIIHRGRLAIVPGIEEDRMFLGPDDGDISVEAVRAQLDEFQGRYGVRHVFPVHLADNPYGGFAMYNSLWFYNSYWLNRATYPSAVNPSAVGIADPIEWRFEAETGLQVGAFFLGVAAFALPPVYPAGANINSRPLQPTGQMLLRELMRRGMIIDLDHMGVLTRQDALQMLESAESPYPAVSGHSGFTELSWRSGETSQRGKLPAESDNTPAVTRRLSALGGMVSPITLAKDIRSWGSKVPNDAPGSAKSWAQAYLYAVDHFGGTNVGLATDFGLVHGAAPRFGMKATFPIKDDELRRGNRASFVAAQSNGVRYAEPISDYREHRFQGPNEGPVYDATRKEFWEAIAMYRSGADPDGRPQFPPRTERIRHLCRGMRAHSTAELEAALRNLPPIPGDAPHEIRAGFQVSNTRGRPVGGDQRVAEIYDQLLPIWERWTQMEGTNTPLHRCTMNSILDADRNKPYLKEWDINLDGMAHYGLLPDFLQDLKNCGLDRQDLRPLFRSAEDYIRLWERCERSRYRGP